MQEESSQLHWHVTEPPTHSTLVFISKLRINVQFNFLERSSETNGNGEHDTSDSEGLAEMIKYISQLNLTDLIWFLHSWAPRWHPTVKSFGGSFVPVCRKSLKFWADIFHPLLRGCYRVFHSPRRQAQTKHATVTNCRDWLKFIFMLVSWLRDFFTLIFFVFFVFILVAGCRSMGGGD